MQRKPGQLSVPRVTNILMKNNKTLSILHALFSLLFLKQPWKFTVSNWIFKDNGRSGIKILVFLRSEAELPTALHGFSRKMVLSRRALSLRRNYSYLEILRSAKEWWIILSNNLFVWGIRELLGKSFLGGWGGMEGGKGNELSLVSQGSSLPAETECWLWMWLAWTFSASSGPVLKRSEGQG